MVFENKANVSMIRHLIHIGAQKSGSTYLWYLLRQSKAFTTTEKSELNIFVNNDAMDYHEYLDLFLNKDQILFENSANYFRNGGRVAKRLEQTLSGQPVLLSLILRNPVTCIRSHYEMHLRQGRLPLLKGEQPPTTMFKYLQRHPEYMDRCRYAEMLENNWLSVFRQDQIKVYFFEEFIKNPAAVVSQLLDACGAGSVDEIDFEIAFTNAAPKSLWIYRANEYLVRNPRIRSALSRLTKNRVVRRAIHRLAYTQGQRQGKAVEPDAADAARLISDALSEDVSNLKRLLGRDVLPWPQFEPGSGTPSAGTDQVVGSGPKGSH